MGCDYALVYETEASLFTSTLANTPRSHLYYNIPPALLLTVCYYPLCTKIDIYKILFLIVVCFDLAIVFSSLGLHFSGRCRIDYAMGFLSHPPSNMDISSQCNHWTDSVQDTRRRDLLLLHPDLQHINPLPVC